MDVQQHDGVAILLQVGARREEPPPGSEHPVVETDPGTAATPAAEQDEPSVDPTDRAPSPDDPDDGAGSTPAR